MSKFKSVLTGLKKAAPVVKLSVVFIANGLDEFEFKGKAKVEKALQGAYKAADVVERVL